jgi:hypothetical protein
MTQTALARAAGISRQAVAYHVQRGTLMARRSVDGSYVIDEDDARSFITRRNARMRRRAA